MGKTFSNATLIHHQGYGDLFTNNPLVNFYAERYDKLVVFAYDEPRKKLMQAMYSHKENIEIVVPKYSEKNKYESSCIICMTPGTESACPRVYIESCKYIDYDEYQDYENIKIGCFKPEYSKWDNFMSENYKNNISFSHSFYIYEKLELSIRENWFSVNRDLGLESEAKKILVTNDYIVVHDDPERSININKKILPPNLYVYNLNNVSKTMIDQISILENAQEIHFIDSNYSVMIYFLSLTNEKIKKIPKFLHYYTRPGRDILIYENPIPANWSVIKEIT